MKTVLAIVLYTLSLFGIELGHQVRVDRIQRDGADVLWSKVVAQPTGTRFECLRSASGKCYYTVPARACAGDARTACRPAPEHLVVAMGESRQVPGQRGLGLCVGADARAAADCD